MTSLKDRLRADLTAAMKQRDELTTATLRMALTAIRTEEVAGGEARELDDAAVEKVIAREAKKRRESSEAFTAANRPELAEREDAEEKVLAAYLPEQLGDDQLVALVTAAVAEAGATSPQQMGAVMKIVQPKIAGQVDGSRVAAEVKRQLSG